MFINNDRDIIIISHPRSGSFWLQSCLPHFNCLEAFNVVGFDITGIANTRFTNSPYRPRNPQLTIEDEHAQVRDRIKLVDTIEKPKVVKIQTFQFNDDVVAWLGKQDADIIWLERRDKATAFRSLLIAETLGRYTGSIDKQSVVFDISLMDLMYEMMFERKLADLFLQDNINRIQHLYYEDLLNDPSLVCRNLTISKQNTTAVVIENWDEVIGYIKHHLNKYPLLNFLTL